MRPAWLVLLFATSTVGCAVRSGPAPELHDARVALDQARWARGGNAALAEVREAERALAYAEFEERVAPGHPLSVYRARQALALAQRARQATQAPASSRPPVAAASPTPPRNVGAGSVRVGVR
jgi:hypothetical protein